MSFDVGDTVRCTNHPLLNNLIGVVTFRNESFAKITYTCKTEHIQKVVVLHVSRLIKHTPQEFVSPLIQKIKELEYRFKNKNSPNPYAPSTGYEYDDEEEEEDDEYNEDESESHEVAG